MRRLGWVLALLLTGAFSLVLVPSPAYACSCRQSSVNRSFSEAEVVFRGRYVSSDKVTQRGADRVDLRFEVDAVYKGDAFRTQLVATADNSASCGFAPDVGTTWVVFARTDIEGSGDQTVRRLTTNLCSGNLPTSAPPRVLGPPRTPIPGDSDREEKTVRTDQRLDRGLAYAGIGVLFVGSLAVLGLVWLWRPGRRR